MDIGEHEDFSRAYSVVLDSFLRSIWMQVFNIVDRDDIKTQDLLMD